MAAQYSVLILICKNGSVAERRTSPDGTQKKVHRKIKVIVSSTIREAH